MMVVNKTMASQPMCVARLRNMVEELYHNPHKDPLNAEALNNTQVPPSFGIPAPEEVNKEIDKEIEEAAPIASDNKVTNRHFSESMTKVAESGGWELVHDEPPVDIYMDEIQLARPTDSNGPYKHSKLNGFVQHDSTTLDAKSLPSSLNPSPRSSVVRTYTPLSNSSEEEGTASEQDIENLEDGTLGLLRPKKKHTFHAPDLFKNPWNGPKRTDSSDALSVCESSTNDIIIVSVCVDCERTQVNF